MFTEVPQHILDQTVYKRHYQKNCERLYTEYVNEKGVVIYKR